MKPTRDDDQDLQELFDTTAATPDTRTLERLERAAAAAPRMPRSALRPVWVAALLAAAAGMPLLWRAATPAQPEASGALERVAPRAVASEPSAPSSLAVAAAAEDEAQAVDDDVADVLDDLALDPGDLTDAELDAWISAAGSTLDG